MSGIDSATLPIVVRIVAVGSAKGIYGGPFDTASRQIAIYRTIQPDSQVVFGAFRDDEPRVEDAISFRVHRIPGTKGFSALVFFAGLPKLWAAIAHADVVHVSIARESVPVVGAVMALIRRKPLVLQPHGMLTGPRTLKHRLADVLLLPLCTRASKILALTPREGSELHEWLHRKGPKIQVQGNPPPIELGPLISLRPEVFQADRPRVVSFIGRLHPRKRVGDFLEAARILQGNQDLSFVVVGPDSGDAHLVVQYTRLNANLSYVGGVDSREVTERVLGTDIFVLPSKDEAWGNVLVLALAAGIPVVVTESAALAPRIRQSGAGIVVHDGAPTQIAQALTQLHQDSQMYALMKVAARSLGSSLTSVDSQLGALRKLYVGVLNTSGS